MTTTTARTTVTEALADLKTVSDRIHKKQAKIAQYLVRDSRVVDPLERDGGSPLVISQERQALRDLEERKVAIRRAVARAAAETELTVTLDSGKTFTRSIADWLVFRREVASDRQRFLQNLTSGIEAERKKAQTRGATVAEGGQASREKGDLVVHANERELHQEVEDLVEVLGRLDGLLSLKNATTTIEV